MTQTNASVSNDAAVAAEKTFYLSEILGARAIVQGRKIGKLTDMIINKAMTFPAVTDLLISLPFGEAAVIPWEKVQDMERESITLNVPDLSPYRTEPPEGAVLLKDYILDKKAIDMEGHDLDVVYDIKLTLRNGKLFVTDVDLSRYGLLRRMGLAGLAKFIYSLAERIREQTIPWTLIQPLPEDLDRFRGDLQLKVLKERLADMHPVDLADILEEMDPDQRADFFDNLDPDIASDTLEEIEPAVQRDLVEELDIAKVAALIDKMTTGQAADVLSILSTQEADEILKRLDPKHARRIQAILDRQEENILDLATQEYMAFPPDLTAEQAQDQYRYAAKGKDAVMYIHIVDGAGRLLGMLDIKELLRAEPSALLKDVMVENPITLNPGDTLKEAAEMFTRYDFRALPITDDQEKLLGVVSYRDVIQLKHRFIE